LHLYKNLIKMKQKEQTEKKLSLRKIQITKLSMIRGGDANDNLTNGDTTTSKNCPVRPQNPTNGQPPVVILGGDPG